MARTLTLPESAHRGPTPFGTPAEPSSFGRDSIHTVLATGGTLVAGIGISIVLARLLGPTGLGSYELVVATSSLLSLILGLSLPAAITYVVAIGRVDWSRLVRDAAGVVLLQTLFAAIVIGLLSVSGYSAAFFPIGSGAQVFLVIIAFVGFSGLAGVWRGMLLGRQRIVEVNHRDLLVRAIQIAFLGGLASWSVVVGGVVSFLSALWILAAAQLFAAAIFLHAVLRSPGPANDDNGLIGALRFAGPMHASNVAQFLNYKVHLFLIGYYLGVTGVAFYALAATIAQLIWLIPTAASAVLFPRVATGQVDPANVIRTVQATRITLWFSIASAIAMALAARPMVQLAYGGAYEAAVVPLLWLLPGVVVLASAKLVSAYFSGVGRPQVNLLASLVGLVLTFGLGLALIPRFGILGAAIASTASYVATALVLFFVFKWRTGQSQVALLVPARSDFRVVVNAVRSLAQQPTRKTA